MLRFLLKKIPSVLGVIVASSIIAFLLPRLAPGDPAVTIAGEDATPEQLAAVREQMGLAGSLPEQYWDWISGILTGDLGTSYTLRRPVTEIIFSRLESTFELAILATVLMVVLGIGLGMLGGTKRSRWSRVLVDGLSTTLLAMPPFLTALILILLLGIVFPVLPVSGDVPLSANVAVGLQYLILPAVALALPQAATVARLLQTAMLTTRGEDFVDLARAKGVSEGVIVRRHILRNSLGPAIVAIGLRFGDMLAGAIIIEAIFARNGVGAMAIYAVQSRDYITLQAIIVGAVLIAVLTQLLSEIVLAAMDPRIRLDA